jgi:DNA segregation ATPase FtsK/SpoIIIE-like protein
MSGTDDDHDKAFYRRYPDADGEDALYIRACNFVLRTGHVSVSRLQRAFNVGFYQAYGWVERMQANGVIAVPPDRLHWGPRRWKRV